MTKEMAIRCIRLWKRTIPKHNFSGWLVNSFDFKRACWEEYAADLLIRRIRESSPQETPAEVILRFERQMEDILSSSDDGHVLTHTFASVMENTARDIRYDILAKESTMYDKN